MSLLKEIKEMIDKEKKSVLLSSPNVLIKEERTESTVSGRGNPRKTVSPDAQTKVLSAAEKAAINSKVDSREEPNVRDIKRIPPSEEESRQQALRDQNKHLRAGFNMYHGLLTQVFMEVQNVTGEAAQIIRKQTQLALQELNQDPEVNSVFQSSGRINPKSVAQIIQKVSLDILMHLAKKAEQEAIEKEMFKKSTVGE